MAFKDILKVFKLERELTDDETALLNTLRGMSESERELLAETLGPAVKAKAKPTATKRVIEKCGICDYTRRAAHHKEGHKDYHEFQPSQSLSKSKRASSIAERLPKPLGQGVKADEYEDGDDYNACMATIDDNGGEMTCGRTVDDNIHHRRTDPDFHPFVSSLSARNAVGQSSTNDDEANSGTGSEDVSVAVGGGD